MDDEYISAHLKAIKEARTDQERVDILEEIYQEGFEDGHDSAEMPSEMGGNPISRLFIVAEDAKCVGCLWNGRLFVIADSQQEADKAYKTGNGGLCANCICNLLGEEERRNQIKHEKRPKSWKH